MSYYPPAPVYGGGWGAQPALDPLISREIGGWFGKAFGIMRRSWRGLLAVAALALLPETALFAMAGLAAAGHEFVLAIVLGGVGAVVAWFMLFLAESAAVWLAARQAAGLPATVGRAYGFALSRFGALLGRGILFGLLALGGLVLCLIPGLFVIAVAAATMPAIVLFERGGGLVRRAFRLFNAQFWPAVGRVMLAWLVVSAATSLFQFIPQVAGLGRVTQTGDAPDETVKVHGIGTLAHWRTADGANHYHWSWHLSVALLVATGVALLLGQLLGMVARPAFELATYAWLRGVENPQLTTATLVAGLDGQPPAAPQQPTWA
ncbi:MAG: hypothetical protein ACJ73S_30545 [Mycobacteriales bacterium]